MHMQAFAFRPRLIFADHTESLATIQVGINQISAILDIQHGLLPFHAPYRTFPVGQKNISHVDSRFVRMVYQPVVSLSLPASPL